ncbi:mannitol-1-phosphate 5-dehydrogenase [Cohnella nanjingensis]|uniref:Mannitol-1-phosphate 5-dehydrogenase n=1 Tax=Cohnella nanjingensis TaxID=1387779 RepID=A0A7X0RP00_9BACL|nr:mannitol-1-phosphate 5-dehydrogenase [Cohnella nanjingensis]MBB6670798.1 mannitol-1-phosphate 5-dehydrogenase [Cohnella nanjingensis]
MNALVIGGGKIGRGFIGQVLYEAGYQLTFVDVSEPLIRQINDFKQYTVVVLGASQKEILIERIRGHLPHDPASIQAFSQADIVTTAVGPAVLPKTADFIAQGIKRRYAERITKPVSIIACENMAFGSSVLFQEVKKKLSENELEFCDRYIGFPDAEVSRMVLPISEDADNPLGVKVEQYMEWIVDREKVKGDLSKIREIKLTNRPEAYIKRKMYTLSGHAMLAYLGFEKGYRYVFEAAYDEEIFQTVFMALTECGEAWCAEYGMSREEYALYVATMLRRFSDPRLEDPISRVAQEPLRKLGANERFIGPACNCLEHNIEPVFIIKGILSALFYRNPADQQSIMLQRMLEEDGIEEVLQKTCGLDRSARLYQLVLKAFRADNRIKPAAR